MDLLLRPGEIPDDLMEFFEPVPAPGTLSDVWHLGPEPYAGEHWAAFPTEIPRRAILAGSRPGDLILDPFVGSGTTVMVALRHGRRALGFDLSPAYVEMARRRITGDAPLLNGTAPVEVEEEPAQLGLWQEPPG